MRAVLLTIVVYGYLLVVASVVCAAAVVVRALWRLVARMAGSRSGGLER